MNDVQHERAMTLLEGRRLELAAAMWQAPSLTLVAQAFLLVVLTDDSVGRTVAWAIAVAGALACGTAMLALWLLHDREVDFSERVAAHAAMLGLGDPRRRHKVRRWWERPLELKGWWFWEAILLAFIVADSVALFCTSRPA